jgi:hypothetical protein
VRLRCHAQLQQQAAISLAAGTVLADHGRIHRFLAGLCVFAHRQAQQRVEEEQMLGQCGQQAPLQVTPLQVLQFVGQCQVQRIALQGIVAGRQQQHRAERPDQLRCVHLRAHPQPRRRAHAVCVGGQLQGLHQRLVLAGIGRSQ